jgi:hypothetical protein
MEIKDVWFRTDLSLRELSEKIGARLDTQDGENYWEWSIVYFEGLSLDLTRTHTKPRLEVDTRIFVYGGGEFPPALLTQLIAALKTAGILPIYTGQWHYTRGNSFDYKIVEEIKD